MINEFIKLVSSFKCAGKGVFDVIKSERNMRIHMAFAFYVIISGIIADVSKSEWMILVLCISSVIGAELFNTALERLCDHISTGYSERIGIVKDISAGAVLILAVGSVVIGGIIFFNKEKIARVVEFICDKPAFAAALFLTLPLWIYFIFRIGSRKNGN